MKTETYRNFHVSRDPRGVTTISLDVPGRPLNVLNLDVMEELESIVHDLAADPKCRLALFRSEKESGFLAGADVTAIAEIESASQAISLIERGQSLFQRIEWLPFPTVAVIHGPCLGGGLELSLACRYRIARDNSSTRIGLPEIKLGLIPGWGGTQRLPQTVGLSHALNMILTGKHLSASQAHRIGLVDLAVGPEQWQQTLDRFVDDAMHQRVPSHRHRRPLWQRAIESTRIGREAIFRLTERKIANQSEHYPALAAALRAVREGFEPTPEGYLRERNEFVDLLATSTCRNLLGIFAARERARSLKTWCGTSDAIHREPIRTVGVVGAGAMGAGIGQLAAVRGYDVIVKEVDEQAADAGRRRIAAMISDFAQRKKLDQNQLAHIHQKLSVTCDAMALAACDLVIEAVLEREDVKAEVFHSLDQHVQPAAILATNTSSLSVANMARATSRPSLVAGLHFFNPVHRMELVEVVRAECTDASTISQLVAFVRALGKTPIVTADSPGFLVNRVLFPYLGEAMLMAGEGIAVSTIDQRICRFGMPMGPLELLDQVGLDVALHVARSLHDILPGVTPVVQQLSTMVERGQTGKKSSSGFYTYRQGKKHQANQLSTSSAPPPTAGASLGFAEDGLDPIQRRLIYPMLAESVRCLEEEVVAAPWIVDLAMVLGTGFAPHRGGPLHVIDAIGVDRVTANLRRLAQQHGDRFRTPARLIEQLQNQQRFFGGLVSSQASSVASGD